MIVNRILAGVFGAKFIILTSILLLLNFLPNVYKKEISQVVADSVNAHLDAKFQFADLEISVYRHFPNLTATMYQVQLIKNFRNKEDTLINVKELDIIINPLSYFLHGQLRVEGCIVRNPQLKLYVSRQGYSNFEVLRSNNSLQDTLSKAAKPNLDIEKIRVIDANIVYRDLKNKVFFSIKNFDFEGKFVLKDSIFKAITQWEVEDMYIKHAKDWYLPHKHLKLNTNLTFNTYSKEINIKYVSMNLSGLVMVLWGRLGILDFRKGIYQTQLSLDIDEPHLQDLIHLIPAQWTHWAHHLESEGRLRLGATMNGVLDMRHARQWPMITANLVVANGQLSKIGSKAKIKDIWVAVHATKIAGSMDHLEVVLDSLKAQLGKNHTMVRGKYMGWAVPTVSGTLQGKIELGDLTPWMSDSLLALGLIDFKGNLEGVLHTDDGRWPRFSLQARLSNGGLKWSHLPDSISKMNVEMHVRNPSDVPESMEWYVHRLTGKVGTDSVSVSGKMLGWSKPYIEGFVFGTLALDKWSSIYPIQDYELRGKAELTSSVSGVLDLASGNYPITTAKLKLHKGYIRNIVSGMEVDAIEFDGGLQNASGSSKDMECVLSKLSFKVDQEPFEAKGYIRNLEDPTFDLDLKGILNLEKLSALHLFGWSSITGLVISDLEFEGKWEHVRSGQYQLVKAKGYLNIDNFSMIDTTMHQERSIQIRTARLRFDPQQLKISSLEGSWDNSNFGINGNVKNYWSISNRQLPMEARLSIWVDHWEHFDAPTAPGHKANVKKESSELITPKSKFQLPFEMPQYWTIGVDTKLHKLVIDSIEIDSIHGQVWLDKGVLRLKESGFSSFGGRVKLNASADFKKPDRVPFALEAAIDSLDLNRLYYYFNPSKPGEKARDNYGTLTMQYQLRGSWSELNSTWYDRLSGKGSISIKRLKVKGMKAMHHVSRLTNKSNLKDSHISDITLQTEIREGTLYIKPSTFDLSGFEAELEGKHRLDNSYMYHILRLGIPPFHLVKIPLHISGNPADPNVSYGKGNEEVRKAIEQIQNNP